MRHRGETETPERHWRRGTEAWATRQPFLSKAAPRGQHTPASEVLFMCWVDRSPPPPPPPRPRGGREPPGGTAAPPPWSKGTPRPRPPQLPGRAGEPRAASSSLHLWTLSTPGQARLCPSYPGSHAGDRSRDGPAGQILLPSRAAAVLWEGRRGSGEAQGLEDGQTQNRGPVKPSQTSLQSQASAGSHGSVRFAFLASVSNPPLPGSLPRLLH